MVINLELLELQRDQSMLACIENFRVKNLVLYQIHQAVQKVVAYKSLSLVVVLEDCERNLISIVNESQPYLSLTRVLQEFL